MTEKPYLLQIGTVSQRLADRYAAECTVLHLHDHPDQSAFLAEHGAKFTAIASDGFWGVPDDVLNALPNLKIIVSNGVGYDAINADAAADRGIVVTHTPNVLNDEVANTAILLWLAVSRRLLPADVWARSGAWERDGPFPLTHSVQDRKVGIIGLGRIGQAIADRAAMFNAEVMYHSRSPKDVPYRYFANLVDMAAEADVLICITPGGPSTRHIVNGDVLRALGPDGIFVNVARGTVVDEPAMVAALQSGELGGAGLDVFEAEPKIPDELKVMDNVVLIPHVGSATVETRQAMGDLVADNLSQFLKDGRVLTPVPECAGFAKKV